MIRSSIQSRLQFQPVVLLLLLLLLALIRAAPPASLSAPDVDFSGVTAHDAIKPGEYVLVVLTVTNKSPSLLTNVTLSLKGQEFSFPQPPTPFLLPAFASETRQLLIRASSKAKFATYHVVLTCLFDWKGIAVFHSAKSFTVNLQVVHQYEDEAKGLPGGSASLLYMILPIFPAFLAFDFFESLRKGDGIKIPKFDSAYIAPAFLIAVGMECLFVLRPNTILPFDSANPARFLRILAISTCAGSAIPLIRSALRAVHVRRTAFQSADSAAAYFTKALIQSPGGMFIWVKGLESWNNYEGFLLQQPDAGIALGARLQASSSRNDPEVTRQLKSCFDHDGLIANRALLCKLVDSKEVSLSFYARIQRGGAPLESFVVTEGLKDFQYKDPENQSIFGVIV